MSFKIMVLSAEELGELRASMEVKLETVGSGHSRFLDRMEPPRFSGRQEDFEIRRQRFIMFIELRSASLARGLQDVHNIPARLTLPEIVCQMAQAM